MRQEDLIIEVLELVNLRQEGSYWDFKREWYSNNQDLLHDIICMANNLVNQDCYIIIGVDEENDFKLLDVSADPNRKTTQNVVDFLRDKKFAGGIRPTVNVTNLTIAKKSIDVLVVRNDRNTPYFLTDNFQGVYANNIYTRVMDSNTPRNRSADIWHIERLWKKRFGIDAAALERVMIYLQQPKDWVVGDESSVKFYKYAPEFTIEDISVADVRNGYEFYLFGQSDSRPHWYDINIKYHQTVLASLGGAALDGGRYFTACPLTDGFSLTGTHNWDVAYKYFIKGTMEYIVHEFFYSGERHEETFSRNRFLECILVFESELEQIKFVQYIKKHYADKQFSSLGINLPYFPDLEGYVMSAFKKDYMDALVLKDLLEEFRNEMYNEVTS